MTVSRFGDPRIKRYLLLPVAYRSLSRPSSTSSAKASTIYPCSLALFFNPKLFKVMFLYSTFA